MKKSRILSLAATFALVFMLSHAQGANETHLDRSKLPDGCNSCHKSHGTRATVMLDRPKEQVCFKCHGPDKRGNRGDARTDVSTTVLKRSNHPILLTARYHTPGENLPERSPATPRHVACEDCHNVHLSTPSQPLRGVKGYSARGAQYGEARKEFQICYRCHSDSANIPPTSQNISRFLSPGNSSYHPVEASGKNRRVPSLKPPLSTASQIECSSCHGNDDRTGPKGPHGSIYEGLLRLNYSMSAGPESQRTYELCYDCHNRNSILNDESFRSHKRHVVYGNTSCFTCHDSHGSRDYDNLIRFDTKTVFPNSTRQLTYMKVVPGKPRCFLNCHVGTQKYDHKMTGGRYCVNTNCLSDW